MSRYRNYWAYSIGLAIAWTIVLVIVSVARPLVALSLSSIAAVRKTIDPASIKRLCSSRPMIIPVPLQ